MKIPRLPRPKLACCLNDAGCAAAWRKAALERPAHNRRKSDVPTNAPIALWSGSAHLCGTSVASVASSQSPLDFDTAYYTRLHPSYSQLDRSLPVNTQTRRLHMAPSHGTTTQRRHLAKLGLKKARYSLYSHNLPDAYALDVLAARRNNRVRLAPAGMLTGQAWALSPSRQITQQLHPPSDAPKELPPQPLARGPSFPRKWNTLSFRARKPLQYFLSPEVRAAATDRLAPTNAGKLVTTSQKGATMRYPTTTRMLTILGLTLALAWATHSPPAFSQSSTSKWPLAQRYYWIVNEETGLALEVRSDGSNNLRMAPRRQNERQYWQYRRGRDGKSRLRTDFARTLALDVINDGTNATIHLARVGNFSGQDWRLRDAHDHTYLLTNGFTGARKYLAQSVQGGVPYLTSRPRGHRHHWKLRRGMPVRFAERFGYRSMRVNGRVAYGERSILMVKFTDPYWVREEGWTHTRTCQDYAGEVVGTSSSPTINQVYERSSNGRFRWSLAACLEMDLPLKRRPDPDTWCKGCWTGEEQGNLILRKLAADGFDFARYDANGDGRVTSNELVLLGITNHDSGGGAVRTPTGGCYRRDGMNVEVCLQQGYLSVGRRFPLYTVAHELGHTLGAPDIYFPGDFSRAQPGGPSQGLSLMAQGGSLVFDPWHKIALGWDRPRIRSLVTSPAGRARLLPAHLPGEERPIVLYDSRHGGRRGIQEYFVLQFRVNSGDYDPNVDGKGLVVWHVRQTNDYRQDYESEDRCKVGDADSAHPGEIERKHKEWCARAACNSLSETRCARRYGCQPTNHRDVGYWCRPITSPATVGSDGKLGANEVWPPGTSSTALRWMDGTLVDIELHVHDIEKDGLLVSWNQRDE